MGLLSKLFNLGEAGLNKVEDKIDDNFGVEIHEVKIKKARERLKEAQDQIDSHSASIHVDEKEIAAYREQVSEYETELASLKELHDKAKAEGKDEEAQNFLDLGFEAKKEIDKLHAQYAVKLETHEYALESVEENTQLIKEMEIEIEREEQQIATIRANQAMIDMHKAQTKLSDDIKGTSVGGQSAVSKLGRKQEEERAKIRIQRERKKNNSASLSDRIAEAKRGSSESTPW